MLKAADLVADTEARKGLLAQLTAANAMAKAGFQRMGTNGGMSDISGNGGAEAKLTKMAQDYEKSHPGTSFVKAYDQITQTDQGRELYKEYLAERREAAK